MLRAIVFILGERGGRAPGEVRRALEGFRAAGLSGRVLYVPRACGDGPLPQWGRWGICREEALCLCEDGQWLRRLGQRGFYVVGYRHPGNAGEDFSGASYIVELPDQVEMEDYDKIYRRLAGLPWTILLTPRCLVREFVPGDLGAIYALYDGEARRFLQAPSEDREREAGILRAYIRRIYGLYGFGHWAVLARQAPGPVSEAADCRQAPGPVSEAADCRQAPMPALPGDGPDAGSGRACPKGEPLIGRIGFAAITGAQEREALRLGIRADIPAWILAEGAAENRDVQARHFPEGDSCAEGGDAPPTGMDADFGFLVAPAFRGRGLALEVGRALLDYGFRQLGFGRVRAEARIDNLPSQKLLQKLGFLPIGLVQGEDGRRKRVFLLDRPDCRCAGRRAAHA